MQLAEQLYAAGIAVFPCRHNKKPAVNKGENWKDYAAQEAHATQSQHDESHTAAAESKRQAAHPLSTVPFSLQELPRL